MAKRKLMELNLLDDFLIAAMITYPGIGEAFSREILKIIFKREFGRLNITSQKTYPGSDTDLHGARLDIYLEEEIDIQEEDIADIELVDEATIIDMEPNQTDDLKSIRALPKRVRFYHAKIDTKALGSGEDYQALKNVVVIMFTPFDPFGHNLMKYTVKNAIMELPDVEYEDGAKTLFFYTNGENCNVDEETRQLLRYMEHTTEENATTDALKRIHKMVEKVKRDEEVSLQYMKAVERREMWIDRGKKLGQEMERENTERERQRADAVTKELAETMEEVAKSRKEAIESRKEAIELRKEAEYWKKLALGMG